MKIAKNPETGLYFDGCGFSAHNIDNAKRLPDSVTQEGWSLIWASPVVIFPAPEDTTDAEARHAARMHVAENGGTNKHGVSRQEFLVKVPSGFSSRKIILPARSSGQPWIRWQGVERAVEMRAGILQVC